MSTLREINLRRFQKQRDILESLLIPLLDTQSKKLTAYQIWILCCKNNLPDSQLCVKKSLQNLVKKGSVFTEMGFDLRKKNRVYYYSKK